MKNIIKNMSFLFYSGSRSVQEKFLGKVIEINRKLYLVSKKRQDKQVIRKINKEIRQLRDEYNRNKEKFDELTAPEKIKEFSLVLRDKNIDVNDKIKVVSRYYEDIEKILDSFYKLGVDLHVLDLSINNNNLFIMKEEKISLQVDIISITKILFKKEKFVFTFGEELLLMGKSLLFRKNGGKSREIDFQRIKSEIRDKKSMRRKSMSIVERDKFRVLDKEVQNILSPLYSKK